MNISVIGGSGFIGTHLVKKLLQAGHTVTILDKVRSEAFPELSQLGDVRKIDDVLKSLAGADVIYNLAAEHRDDVSPESLYFDVNVNGARIVCDAASTLKINKIIFTSTVALYGLDAGRPTEDSPVKPFNAYGHSKHEAERVYCSWAEQDSLRSLTIIRPVVVFGENNRGNVYNLLTQISKKRFLMVGDGDNKKSMAYVINVADFLEFVARMPAGINIYNYADSPDMKTKEIVAIARRAFDKDPVPLALPYWLGLAGGATFDVVAKLFKWNLPISAIRVRKFCADTTVATDKMASLDFQPSYSLTEGLERMIRHEFSGNP